MWDGDGNQSALKFSHSYLMEHLIYVVLIDRKLRSVRHISGLEESTETVSCSFTIILTARAVNEPGKRWIVFEWTVSWSHRSCFGSSFPSRSAMKSSVKGR